MSRPRRLHVPGGLYHAVLRGNHREAIFSHDDDCIRFEEIVARALERYCASLFAYCWMTNHVHLAIRVGEAPLGAVMGIVASRYARARQQTLETTGHLFERRYRARLVDADRYLLALVRYIHLNPARACMVAVPRDLAAIIAAVAAERGVAVEALLSKRRQPALVKARKEIARLALVEGAANLSQVARQLNRAPTTLSGLLRNGR